MSAPEKPICICSEINARNCPVHQGDAPKPREWLIKPATKYTDHLILDSDFELFPGWNDPDYIHVIEHSAYVALEQKIAALSEALEILANFVPSTDIAFVSDQMKMFAREALGKK